MERVNSRNVRESTHENVSSANRQPLKNVARLARRKPFEANIFRCQAWPRSPRLHHPFEPHALAVRKPSGDVAAGEAGLALRHLLLRAAQCFPPRRPMRRARQRRVDDLLDLLEAEYEFGQRLLLQVIA